MLKPLSWGWTVLNPMKDDICKPWGCHFFGSTETRQIDSESRLWLQPAGRIIRFTLEFQPPKPLVR